jgi:hypothetical protein
VSVDWQATEAHGVLRPAVRIPYRPEVTQNRIRKIIRGVLGPSELLGQNVQEMTAVDFAEYMRRKRES